MRFFRFSSITCAIVVFGICPWLAQADDNNNNDNNENRVDFSRLVVVGDSLTAGFQNFSLYDSDSDATMPLGGQKHAYAAKIAQQVGANLYLPLISAPGIPAALVMDQFGVITRGTGFGSRENPLVQTRNLSVPGYTVDDALVRFINTANVTDAIDAMALQVLGFPGLATHTPPCGGFAFPNGVVALSEVGCAVQLRPTAILVSIGNNDALQSLTLGRPPTNSAHFRASYRFLLGSLASTGAKIVVANIPDVTAIPFLFPVPVFQAICHSTPAGAGPTDFVVPDITKPTFNICTTYTVRSGAMIAQTHTAVKDFNAIIASEASKVGAVVVDVNGLFAGIAKNGYQVGAAHLTSSFLGGLFSLDAIHPTNTGHAIIANEFIKTMNSRLGTNIPSISIAAVAQADPLVLTKP
jgi:lysophospholipase L1-like esterase